MDELYKRNEIRKIQEIQFMLDKIERYVENINIQMLFNYSCYFKYLDVATYLLEYDKTIDIHVEKEGIFRMACKVGSIELIDILIKHGEKNNNNINVHIEQCDAVKWAMHSKQIRVVKYLINYCERINDKYDFNCLFQNYDYYIFYNSDDIFKYMIYLNKHNYKFITQLKLHIIWNSIISHKYVGENMKKTLYNDTYIYNNNNIPIIDGWYNMIDATIINYILYI